MKRIAIILAVIIGAGIMQSCEKDTQEPVLKMDEAVAPQITTPSVGGTFVLTEENEEDMLFTFQWNAADYKVSELPEVRYVLQIDITANEWTNPETIRDVVETRSTEHPITVTQMNTLMSRMGVEPFETGAVSFRVLAFLTRASEHTWMYSNPVGVDITTFEAITEPAVLFVPGSWQGWDVGNPNTVLYAPEHDGLYEGYLYFSEPDTEFKFATELGWDENWGDDDGDGTLDPGGKNIEAADPGVYRVNVDLENLTYTTVMTSWAMIGNAADGWDTDVVLEVDEDYFKDTWKTRYKITRQMNVGYFKFRANGNWDLNMGLDEDSEVEGALMYFGYGNDIPITAAGLYTIIFDLSGPVYTYEVIKE